jgi:FkbH-like protein
VADVNSAANSYGKHNFLDDIVYFYSHGSVLDSPVALETDWAQHENWPHWSAPDRGRIEPVPDLAELYPIRPMPFYKLMLDQIRHLNRVVLQVDQVKIVIFDLDNTLWRGQIAEHYESGRQYPDLHNWPVGMWEAVHHLRRRGIVVSLCSRNDENLVRERWSRAVRLPWLALDDFVVPKINWNRKSENVQAILAELNLTAKSAVFVDDNPVDRSEVLDNVPGIRVLGGNPFLTRRILLWSAETQRSAITNESINREASYRGVVARNAESASMDRESFLQNLRIRIEIDHINDINSPLLPRVLELANKTTQFNTTGLKWTVPGLTAFIDDGGAVFGFSVKDKFSDYGLVGGVFVSGGAVRQYVMSCRVLGMDVEVNALNQILQIVRNQDEGSSIVGTVIPTEVNTPCRDIFLRSGFQPTQDAGVFVLDNDASSDEKSRGPEAIVEEMEPKINEAVEYHKWYFNNRVWTTTTWMGVTCLKSVADMWNYQEILFESKPSLIIEFGTHEGGASLFFADVMRRIGRPFKVISVDLDHNALNPAARRDSDILFLESSSTAPAVATHIERLKREFPGKTFAILDSDHSMGHVLAEMKLLRPLLSAGDYLIVEDAHFNGHPVDPHWSRGPGPYEAIEAYELEFPDDYIHDLPRENKFGFTFATNGYLIRV